MTAIRWGILGPGGIATRFAEQLPQSEHGRLVAVASSDPERARAFAGRHGGTPRESHAELLSDPEVDAVYVATVHTSHAPLTIAALEAGKHVLCEKPLAPHHATAMAMVEAAHRSGRVLLEAYMYRFHPLTRQLLAAVAAGTIGEVAHIDGAFSFRTGSTVGRLFDPVLAGGGILDVGGYPVSFARAVAAAAAGRPVEPAEVHGRGTIGDTGVDEWAVAELRFPDGPTATVRAGTQVHEPSGFTVHGSRGALTLSDPWLPGEGATLTTRVVGQEDEVIRSGAVAMYALEADALATAAASGSREVPEMTHADSLGNASVLQDWRDAVGLRFPFEEETADVPTASGRPLRRPSAEIPAGTIDGVGPVSRLVMGCDNQPDLTHASVMFDAFVEAGGTTFDTAHLYGGGRQERLLGRWMANRGIREQVQVVVKGAHTPHCTPEALGSQLEISLERLGIERGDIYLMHRDDPSVPVGEFVDALDVQVRAGRVGVVGGSNWSPDRIEEANAYAAAHGRTPMSVLSNHLSLAEALDVPWAGCRHVSDRASRDWLTERGMPLLPWSSQARGFFAGRADPDDRSDAELVRCFYSDGNFERLRRARALAGELRVDPTAIALAWVLAQPFPTFPLIGPRTLAELRSSLAATRIGLTPEQVAWLDLQD